MGQDTGQIRQEIEETRGRMGETVEALGYKADVPSRAKYAVSCRVDSVKSKISGTTPDGAQVKQGARRTKGMAEENPLGLAIGALAVGFVGGLLIPSTRVEDEKIGDVSDTVTDTIKETGQEAMERGKSVAQEAVGAVEESGKQEAQKLGEGLKERVQETQAETVHQ